MYPVLYQTVGIQSKLRPKAYIHGAYNVVMETDVVTITIIETCTSVRDFIDQEKPVIILGICVCMWMGEFKRQQCSLG